jgi:gas vesicle protein
VGSGEGGPRPVVDHGSSQSGEQHYGAVAGGDITHQGADFGQVLAFLKEYTFESDQRRETTIKEVRAELTAIREQFEKRERYATGEARIASEALTTVRGQLGRIEDRVQDLMTDQAEEKQARIVGQEARAAMDARIARRLLWHSIIIGVLAAVVGYWSLMGMV